MLGNQCPKVGVGVVLFVTFLLAGLISPPFGIASEVSLTQREKQLTETLTFDSSSLKLLRTYKVETSSPVINQITVYMKVLENLLNSLNSNQDHENYEQLQNHLGVILQALMVLSDHMSGAQLQWILKAISHSGLLISDANMEILNKFTATIGSSLFNEESLPIELRNQKARVLNEMVRDSLIDRILKDQNNFYGQEEAYTQTLKTLVRPHKSFPIIVEPAFSGKTQFLLDFTRRLMLRDYPANRLFQLSFKDALVVHLKTSNLLKDQLRLTMEAIGNMKYWAKRPVVIVVEELHLLVDSENPYLEGFLNFILQMTNQRLKFVGTTTPEGWDLIQKKLEANKVTNVIENQIEKINFAPLSFDNFVKASLENLAKDQEITENLGVNYEKGAIERLARFVLDQKDTTQSPFFRMRRLLEDVAIYKLSEDPYGHSKVTAKDVRGYLSHLSGLGFSPDDPEGVSSYYLNVESQITSEIVGQERMIKEVLQVHRDLMTTDNAKRPLRVIGMVGPTGVGKTELAKVFAKYVYGDLARSLRIDGTAYMAKENMWKLTGPTIGYKDSESKGRLIEYLEGKGKNGGVILIDEGEKACPEFWQTMMSVLEDGFIVGGDGKPRFLNNHLIVITSNRGDRQLYPKGFEQWPKDQQTRHLESFKQDQLKALFTQPTGDNKDTLFPDYVIQRMDRFVAANQASVDVALAFVPKLASRLREEIFETHGKIVEIKRSLLEAFVRANFKATSGYRPIFRSFEFNMRRIILDSLPKMSAKDEKLILDLVETEQGRKINVVYSEREPLLQFDFPASSDDSFLRDPQILAGLAKLPEILKMNLVGQDHIIEPLVAAIQQHVMKSDSARTRPLSFFSVGPAGTGKTELAKVLALALLGSSDRVGIIPMGEINSRSKWANFFGGDVGYQGSDVVRLFEQILRANPQGGVVVFDEASNVGGDDKALKSELLKLLYNMIEEGRWTSPTTGIEYNLSKYIFLLTGNDGQELYSGGTDEHLREATWSRYNKVEKLIEILVNAGVPEPLVSRMAALFWARPLNKKEMRIVAEKFLEKIREEWSERKIKLEYSPSFVEEMVGHSYTVMMGARSVRNFVENAVGGLLAKIELKAFEDKMDLSEATIHLSFGDSAKRDPIVRGATKTPTDVFLHGEVTPKNLGAFVQKFNVKAFLAPRGTQSLRQAWVTAVHEGGHAIVNDFAKAGLKVLTITIDSSGGHLGYVNYEDNPHLAWTRQRVVARIASQLAGGLAQQYAGLDLDAGWASDLSSARNIATTAIVHWGLGKGLSSIFYPQLKDDKPQIDDEVLKREVDLLMREGYELSKDVLEKNWKTLLLVTKKLLKQYTLNHDEWESLKEERVRGKVQYERVKEDGVDRMRPIKAKIEKSRSCINALELK